MNGVTTRLVVLALFVSLATACARLESQPPTATFNREFKILGRAPALSLTVADLGSGLKQVTIHVKQKEQDVVLSDESFDRGTAPKSKAYDVGKLIADKFKMQDGEATMTVDVVDQALGLRSGNKAQVVKTFQFSITPPQLEVLSGQHYINQGGSECVIYRVSQNVETSGVQVGKRFFPGYPVANAAPSGDKKLYFALFALQYDEPLETEIKVIARDGGGNQVESSFWKKVFPKKFRSRDIPLEDSFVQKVVPEITSHTPEIKNDGDLVKTFVKINSELRRKNHEALAKYATQSPGQFLWNGPFLQLSNSKVEAFFADRRTYVYQGKPVDQQDHVGFDLSVVQHNPIEAGNDGKVIFADYFGIYGNAVILDHGAGLISLYGHMSSIDVKAGQMVKKKDVLGKSGATGLAGGDHLHFGMFLHGVPVNPTEWWDDHWIKDHITDRFKEAGVK